MESRYPINTPLINVMTSAAHKAARGLIRDFGEVGQLKVSRKGTVDFVSEADLRAERTLKRELGKARPKWGFLMEEDGETEGEDPNMRWVVDPLDGTTNFLHAVPYFAISIAAEKTTAAGSEVIAGVIYDPIHDEMFMAERGVGAYVNDRRLRTSTSTGDFYFVTGTARCGGQPANDASKLTQHASSKECVIRRSGAASLDLAYVAAGRYDACWFPRVQNWDIGAGMLMVKEAGGYVSNLTRTGEAYGSGTILATSEEANKVLKLPA